MQLLNIANSQLNKKRHGWTDDDYRLLLERNGAKLKKGRISATTMNHAQLNSALAELKRLGFRIKSSASTAGWRQPRISKLVAMWAVIHKSGAISDGSFSALEKFCTNQIPGLTKLSWATSQQLNIAIEIVKQFQHRVERKADGKYKPN